MEMKNIIEYLKGYDGRPLKLMEVCGTHTASIFKSGIRDMLSDKIKLISGPGCPVCVTPTAYIDKCIEYSQKPNHVLVTFGDMMKVPGSSGSLSQTKSHGGCIELMYSPNEVLEKARKNPDKMYVIAAVGFETTVPIYGLVVDEAKELGLKNIKILTALKTIIPALEILCQGDSDIDGFICPGHVSVIIGSEVYKDLAKKHSKPFVVAGFEPEHILAVVYDIVKQVEDKRSDVHNLYKNVVHSEGNQRAQKLIDQYFLAGDAAWRGLGIIEKSGFYLREEYAAYDGGSYGLDQDAKLLPGCRCADVITGRIDPTECGLFSVSCRPEMPYGPCMVSSEGACGIWYKNNR